VLTDPVNLARDFGVETGEVGNFKPAGRAIDQTVKKSVVEQEPALVKLRAVERSIHCQKNHQTFLEMGCIKRAEIVIFTSQLRLGDPAHSVSTVMCGALLCRDLHHDVPTTHSLGHHSNNNSLILVATS
jgi:hypothetical protein